MIAPSPRGIALLSINAVFTTLAVSAYLLRFVKNLSRARKGLLPWGHFIITDSLVFAATVLVLLNSVLRIVAVLSGGVGHDVDELSLNQIQWALKAIFVDKVSWSISLCLLKLACIILYGRIFVTKTGKKFAKWVEIVALAAVAALLIASIIFYLTECKPLRAEWTPGIGKCRDPSAGWLGGGIVNLITDVFIFGVPAIWLADMQMSLHNKITVGIQLFIGATVCIISLVRIFYTVNVDPKNFTGSVVKADILSCIELTMAIVFASMAGIAGREAISNVVDRFIISRRGSSGRLIGMSDPRADLPDVGVISARKWVKIDEESVEEEARSTAQGTHDRL